MLEMMSQMMGKPGQQAGKAPSESQQGGQGATADSNSANTENKGAGTKQDAGERRVPRAAGKSGTTLPAEFQKALDGYNKKAKAP